mgnify:CR=1 FL=1
MVRSKKRCPLKRKINANNIHFKGNVDWEKVVHEYKKSDILYAQITQKYSSAVPTKIFEYIATGLPVVLGLPNGPAKEIFSKFSGVYIHNPEDHLEFMECFFESLGDNKTECKLFDIADDFSYKNRQNFTLRHFMERINIYNGEDFNYEIHNVELFNGSKKDDKSN